MSLRHLNSATMRQRDLTREVNAGATGLGAKKRHKDPARWMQAAHRNRYRQLQCQFADRLR